MTPIAIPPKWMTPDPPGIAGSYGPRACRWAKDALGITVSGWQKLAINAILRHDRRGDLVHRIALISTARQNGKSVVVRVILGWLLHEGRDLPPFRGWSTMLAAAHDAKQARIAYRALWIDTETHPSLKAKTRSTEWRGLSAERPDGTRIDFDTVTSQPGSARGLSAGAIAWDEVVTQRDWDMWEVLSPTQSAQRSPIMLLTSTAGLADSIVLRAFFDRMVRQTTGAEKADPSFLGMWWQAEDPDAGLDWDQIQMANPALGDGRLTKAAIESEFRLLPPDSWRRERLNHWIEARVEGAINPALWAACRVPLPLQGLSGPYSLGIDIQPGWDRATIAVGGIRDDGRVGVEVFADMRSTDGSPITADRILDKVHAFPDPVAVIAYDGASAGAPAFLRDELDSALPWDALKPAAMVSACTDTDEMIRSGRLAVDDPLLDAQIAWTARRPVGMDGAFRFTRKGSAGPIDAVMAMTLAAHAITFASMPGIY